MMFQPLDVQPCSCSTSTRSDALCRQLRNATFHQHQLHSRISPTVSMATAAKYFPSELDTLSTFINEFAFRLQKNDFPAAQPAPQPQQFQPKNVGRPRN